MKKQTGVLLLNLGTPDDPSPAKVGEYLREFLMDPHVVDIPAPVRWILVNQVIVPRRSHASSEAYRKIWHGERGSPLKYHSEDLTRGVSAALGAEYDVKFAMRYRSPSIASVLSEWRGRDLAEIRVLPLYPQYAKATNFSSEEAVREVAAELGIATKLRFLRPFYGDAGFLGAFARRTSEVLREGECDHVLFSFHGLPERQLRKADRENVCLKSGDCCDRPRSPQNDTCYRAHCYATARGIAERLGLPRERWSISFQSRLGRTKWIEPYTDVVLPELAARGARHVVVVCPAFVADCLETLEEIGMRAVELFRGAGGSTLRLVPSLNSEPDWIDAVAELARGESFR
ncbi:MAG: ferrochelatase [Bdellovibrionales bacterium]|nr:ferrochelatase [Bdellovibrionales bacterium]